MEGCSSYSPIILIFRGTGHRSFFKKQGWLTTNYSNSGMCNPNDYYSGVEHHSNCMSVNFVHLEMLIKLTYQRAIF